MGVEEVEADHASSGQKHHRRFPTARAVKSQVASESNEQPTEERCR